MINSSPGRISQPFSARVEFTSKRLELKQFTRRDEQRRSSMRRVPRGDDADLRWMRKRLLLFQRTPEAALEAAQMALHTLQNLH